MHIGVRYKLVRSASSYIGRGGVPGPGRLTTDHSTDGRRWQLQRITKRERGRTRERKPERRGKRTSEFQRPFSPSFVTPPSSAEEVISPAEANFPSLASTILRWPCHPPFLPSGGPISSSMIDDRKLPLPGMGLLFGALVGTPLLRPAPSPCPLSLSPSVAIGKRQQGGCRGLGPMQMGHKHRLFALARTGIVARLPTARRLYGGQPSGVTMQSPTAAEAALHTV